MRVIDLENINYAMRSETQFVLRCEEVFHDKISAAATTILSNKGEKPLVALTGPSGSGKTTLLRLVGDLEKPNSGEIRFAVTHKTAFVFQEPRLMPWLTVWDNTIFGLKKHSYDTGEIQALLETVGLDGFQKAIPISFRAECSKEPLSRVLWRMRPPSF